MIAGIEVIPRLVGHRRALDLRSLKVGARPDLGSEADTFEETYVRLAAFRCHLSWLLWEMHALPRLSGKLYSRAASSGPCSN